MKILGLGPTSAPPRSPGRPSEAPPSDRVHLSGGPSPAEDRERVDLTPWQKVGLAGLAGLSILGPLAAAGIRGAHTPPVVVRPARTRSNRELSAEEWRQLLQPKAGEERPVQLPGTAPLASQRYAPRSIEATRERLDSLGYPDLNPYVASVASDMWASVQGGVKDSLVEYVRLPGSFEYSVRVGMSLDNGQDAPMLLILPGVGGSHRDAKVQAFKRMALEAGMNYVSVDNAFGPGWLYSRPAHDPGNLQNEAKVTYDLLQAVRAKHPEHFRKMSVVGYSYGGSLAASMLRHQQQTGDPRPLITGSVVSLSPPEHMVDSMRELDGLRHRYEGKKVGSAVFRALAYRGTLREEGYEGFLKSHLARRDGDEALTELMMVDQYGSRSGMESAIQYLDRMRGHLKLPLNAREAERRWPIENYEELRDRQEALLDASTYGSYLGDYLGKDPWFAQHGTTPEEVGEAHRYSRLMKDVAGKGVPVMTLASADDYILTARNVQDFRRLEVSGAPDQVAKVYEKGGHTGLMLNPDLRQAMMDFLRKPPASSEAEKWLSR